MSSFAIAAENSHSVAVVVGANAPALDRFAARELCTYLHKLFGVDVVPDVSLPASTRDIFFVGNPTTNPEHQLQPTSRLSPTRGLSRKQKCLATSTTLIVGGGSPRATLWAVYDLVGRWDVRFLIHGDVFPSPKAFSMPRLDSVKEPILRVRQWRVHNEHAMGPISWGLADYRPVIDQLAKLRFNRLLLYIWPGQPFLPLEYKGIRQTSGTLFFGNRFPITDDMIGRSLFGGESEFWNPDIPPHGHPEAISKAAIQHVQSLISYAHARGMECVMSANLTEFPKEFKPLLAHMHPVDMMGTPTIGPGADANLDDPVLARPCKCGA